MLSPFNLLHALEEVLGVFEHALAELRNPKHVLAILLFIGELGGSSLNQVTHLAFVARH